MQWNDVKPGNMPEPGEPVLGLWNNGIFDRVYWQPERGWYNSNGGKVAPVKWCCVDDAVTTQPQEPQESAKSCDDVAAQRPVYPETYMPRWLLQKLDEMDKQIFANLAAANPKPADTEKLALDVSLEKARALHRVWRALNDGDCPKCHTFHGAAGIQRASQFIQCPDCTFTVWRAEIDQIQEMFAPAMDAAVKIFEDWRDAQCKQTPTEPATVTEVTSAMLMPGCRFRFRNIEYTIVRREAYKIDVQDTTGNTERLDVDDLCVWGDVTILEPAPESAPEPAPEPAAVHGFTYKAFQDMVQAFIQVNGKRPTSLHITRVAEIQLRYVWTTTQQRVLEMAVGITASESSCYVS